MEIKKINIPSLILILVGFSASLYALIVHIQGTITPNHGSICDINATVSCSDVITSEYGALFGIPNGAWGMAFFVMLLSAVFLPKIAQLTRKQLAVLELFLGTIGLIIVISFMYISYAILHKVCPTCVIVHVVAVLYFLLKIFQFILYFKDTNNIKSDFLSRFFAVAICLAIPPLAAGLIAPIIVVKWVQPQSVTTPESSVLSTNKNAPPVSNNGVQSIQQQPPVNPYAQMLKFNKTNYVGDGEDYRIGSDDAKIIVQMFSDFGCPHCRDANEAILAAQADIGPQNILYIYRYFPLSNKCNPFVTSAGWYTFTCKLAEAVRCAGEQGKFWEFKAWAFQGQDVSDSQRNDLFSDAGLEKEATSLGLNAPTFKQCLTSGVELQKIKDDAAIANGYGIKGTPMIFINGKQYEGGIDKKAFLDEFKLLLSQ